MKKMLSVFLCITMIVSCLSYKIKASEDRYDNCIFVSSDGDDSNSGTISEPLLTLNAAKEKAKLMSGEVTVYFRDGQYTITQTVNFNSSDKENVNYKAFNNEKVVFTAGIPYSNFEETTVNSVKAFKKYVGKNAKFNVLFNDKATLSRTRYPEKGYLYVKSVSSEDTLSEKKDEYFSKFIGFTADASKMIDFKNKEDVVVRLLHFWKDEMATIKDYNTSTGQLKLSRETSMTIKKNDRFFFENVLEALNEPGEWYLDKSDGFLYYIPFKNEYANKLTLWASTTEKMISVDGVNGISFENIVFRGNGFDIPHNNELGDTSSQAAYDATPCVSFVNSKNFKIKNCEFRDIAGGAVFLGVSVQNVEISNNIFDNIGAQAVYVRGNNVQINDPTITKNIKIINNLVSGFGRVFYNAVGFLIIHANSVDVIHNEIHDGYYTAISVGWVWGFSYSVTSNCKIQDNLIYNIGQGWLSDMGGIYMLGIQKDTIISGNVIHNVAADPGEGGYGGWGIYLDEGSSLMLVEKNLVYSCGSDAYHLHYGAKNIVKNNIFALSGESQVRVVTAFQNVSDMFGSKITAEFKNNILLSDKNTLTFSYMNGKSAFVDDNNIFWDLSKGNKVFASLHNTKKKTMSISKAVRKGYINNAVIANPMFSDAENFDFELCNDSPAVNAGFEKWDYSNAGTLKGTVIGNSNQGGTTPYNADSYSVEYAKIRKPFEPFTAIRDFFIKIYKYIFAK